MDQLSCQHWHTRRDGRGQRTRSCTRSTPENCRVGEREIEGGRKREREGYRRWGRERVANLPSVATEESGLANHFPRGRKFSVSSDLCGQGKEQGKGNMPKKCSLKQTLIFGRRLGSKDVYIPLKGIVCTYIPLNEVVEGTV